jgi:DNA-binding transcriptional LysR family regulator
LGDWETPEIPIHAVFPPQRHPSAKLRAFVDFLVERLGRRDGWLAG